MINLEKLFFTRKSEPAQAIQPEVVAFVVAKKEQADAYSELLTSKGFTIAKADVETGVLTVKEDVADDVAKTVIKLSDELAVVVTHVTKDFYGCAEGTSFNENLTTCGFYPGVYLALDTLASTIFKCMDEAGEPEMPDCAASIGTAIDEFKTYVVGLVRAIPQTAFKAERLVLPEPVAKSDEAPAGDPAEETAVTDPAPDAGEQTGEPAAGGDPAGEPAGEPEPVAKNEPAAEAGAESLAAQMSSAMESITKSILGVLEPQLQELTAKIDTASQATTELKGQLETISKSVEDVTVVAKKAEEAAAGTLLGAAPAGDPPPAPVRKRDTSLFASALSFDGFE